MRPDRATQHHGGNVLGVCGDGSGGEPGGGAFAGTGRPRPWVLGSGPSSFPGMRDRVMRCQSCTADFDAVDPNETTCEECVRDILAEDAWEEWENAPDEPIGACLECGYLLYPGDSPTLCNECEWELYESEP